MANLSLLLGAVATFILLLEVVIRLLAIVKPPIMVLDGQLGWIHRPNVRRTYSTEGVRAVCQTNSLGLRGPLPEETPGRPRFLILGDSYTDGLEVSDSDLFSKLWAEMRPDLAIYNGGVGGYSTVQELGLYRRLESKIKPDQVVVMVSWNDLSDNLLPFYPSIGPRPYVDAEGNLSSIDWNLFRPFLPPLPGSIWLQKHSLAAYVVQNRFLGFYTANRQKDLIDHWSNRIPEGKRWMFLGDLVARMAKSRPTIIVGIPSREDVKSGDRQFIDRLAQMSDRLGLRWVDLQPVLRGEDYYSRDIHWRASGHHRVAKHLASVINPAGLAEFRDRNAASLPPQGMRSCGGL